MNYLFFSIFYVKDNHELFLKHKAINFKTGYLLTRSCFHITWIEPLKYEEAKGAFQKFLGGSSDFCIFKRVILVCVLHHVAMFLLTQKAWA